jgi:hypothetical protein
MRQSRVVVSDAHALVKKPALAVLAKPDGGAWPVEPDTEDSRTARIREAAFRLYEARGCLHGHDVEDWLAAEATMAGNAQQA